MHGCGDSSLGRSGGGQSAMKAAVDNSQGVHGHGHGAPSLLGRGRGDGVRTGRRMHGHWAVESMGY